MIASVISSFKEVCSTEVQTNGEKAVDKPQRVCLFFKNERHNMLDVERKDEIKERETDDAGRTAGAMWWCRSEEMAANVQVQEMSLEKTDTLLVVSREKEAWR